MYVSLFRTGDYFLEEARARIAERHVVRAMGIWSGRQDVMKMEEIKKKINMRIASLYKYPSTDCQFMTMWLRRSKQDCFIDSGFIKLEKLLPAGAHVIDYLRVDAERPAYL